MLSPAISENSQLQEGALSALFVLVPVPGGLVLLGLGGLVPLGLGGLMPLGLRGVVMLVLVVVV